MALVDLNGQMDQFIKESFKITILTDKEHISKEINYVYENLRETTSKIMYNFIFIY